MISNTRTRFDGVVRPDAGVESAHTTSNGGFRRRLSGPEHAAFRRDFRAFVEREIVPYAETWERQCRVDKSMLRRAGDAGFLGMGIPSRYGGSGTNDFRHIIVQSEELARSGGLGCGLSILLHNLVCSSYLMELTNSSQKARWLPGLRSGHLVATVAVSEDAEQDPAAIGTVALQDGSDYIVSGEKAAVGNGLNADLIVVAARTNPYAPARNALSLLAVDAEADGIIREHIRRKVGLQAQDTVRLILDNVRVPATNLLGEEGHGLRYVMASQGVERMTAAASALALAQAAFDWTRACHDGKASAVTRVRLAELRTELDVAQAFLDRCVEIQDERALRDEDSAKAKWWTTELMHRVVTGCIDLHDSEVHTLDSLVAKAYLDARASAAWGGTTDAMKELIGVSLAP